MSDQDAVAPYTGRTSGRESATPDVPPSAGVPTPRIRWGRMTLVQFAAGFLAAFVLSLAVLTSGFSTGLQPSLVVVGILIAVVVALVGGGLPLLGAGFGYFLATRGGRGAGRELLGVVLGALSAAVLLSVVLFWVIGGYAFALLPILVIGVPSAIGFSIWVLVAWRPHLQSRPVR